MRPLRYSINITIDGCCDHRAGMPTAESHERATRTIEQADALLFGRVTYELMESAWREPGPMPDSLKSFAASIGAAKKYVVSSTLPEVDWNAELVRGDLEQAVRELKAQPGNGLYVGGVTLPLALAGMGLIDEYEFVVHPRIAGRGPYIFAGLSQFVDLELIGRQELGEGLIALTYQPR